MVLSEAIRDYGEYARHEAGHTRTTLFTYLSWQRNFARWLEENGHGDPAIQEVSAGLIRRWAYALSGRNLRPRTIRGALHAIRAVFSYLVEMQALPANPALEVKLPKRDAATRLTVTDEDLVALLAATEKQRSEFRCLRDRAVLAVLIFGGLRRQELLDLTVPAINLNDQSRLVQQGKGQKSRTIYLCDEALVALREWLAYRQTLKCSHERLFVSEGKRPFGEISLTSMLEEIKAIASLRGDPRIKPHSIRHAAATRLLRNGADIRSIQAWLGHSQLQTTAIYLHTDEQQVRRIARLAGFSPGSEVETSTIPSSRPKESPADFFRQRRRASREPSA